MDALFPILIIEIMSNYFQFFFSMSIVSCHAVSLTSFLCSVIVEWYAVLLGRMTMLEQDVTSLQPDLTVLCTGGPSTHLRKERIKFNLLVLFIHIYICMHV